MRALIIIGLVVVTSCGGGPKQPPRDPGGAGPARVENVRAEAASSAVTVTYDLVAPNAPVAGLPITIEASLDGGRTFPVKPVSVRGDVGPNVKPGTGRRIVWDAAQDSPVLQLERFAFRVLVTPSAGAAPPPTKPAPAERAGRPAASPVPAGPAVPARATPVKFPSAFPGRLEVGDETVPADVDSSARGGWADSYAFTLDGKATVSIRMDCDTADCRLSLRRVGSKTVVQDWGPTVLVRRSLEPGSYVVWAGARVGTGGRYQLQFAQGAAPPSVFRTFSGGVRASYKDGPTTTETAAVVRLGSETLSVFVSQGGFAGRLIRAIKFTEVVALTSTTVGTEAWLTIKTSADQILIRAPLDKYVALVDALEKATGVTLREPGELVNW